MYSSWWFRLLMAMLVVNLVFCSIKRFPTAMKLSKPIKPEKIKPEFLNKQTNNRTINLKGDPKELTERLKTIFRNRFKAPGELTADWGRLFYADRGAFSRYGAYIVHLSLLLFIAGGIIGSVSGFTAQMQLRGRSDGRPGFQF